VFYVPIIKSKRGEFTAIRLLHDDIKEHIRPFVDVLPPSRFAPKPKTLAEQLTWVADHVSKAWAGALWVDTFDVGPSIVHGKQVAIEFICQALRAKTLAPVPVTGFEREVVHDQAVRRFVSEAATGVCLRLEEEDLLLPTKLPALLGSKLKLLGVEAPSVDLLFDLRYLDETPAAARVQLLTRALQNIGSLDTWRSIICAGSSMPNSLDGVCARGSHGYLARRELEIWLALQHAPVKRMPTFGDYTTVPPQYADMDTRTIAKHLGPNVKYTLDKRWYVSRGHSFQKSGSAQYFGIARDIVSLPDFRGPTASDGDSFIAQRANGGAGVKCGNPEQWVTASVNSHISWQTRWLTLT
jgi:Beta protein